MLRLAEAQEIPQRELVARQGVESFGLFWFWRYSWVPNDGTIWHSRCSPMTSEVMDSDFPFSDTEGVAMTAKEATK